MAGSTVANLMQTQSSQLKEQTENLTRDFEDAIGIRVADFSSRFAESGNSLKSLLDARLAA